MLESETSLEPDRLIDSFIVAFEHAQETLDVKLMAAILDTPFRNDQDVKKLRTFILNHGESLFEALYWSEELWESGMHDGQGPLATLIDLHTVYGGEELGGEHLLDGVVSREITCIGHISFHILMD